MELPSLQLKIDDLFGIRKIPWMLERTDSKNPSLDLAQLKELQGSIYALDQYLESVWQLDQNRIKTLWNDILKSLKAFHIEFPDTTTWCDEINRYLHHEMDMRDGKSPLRFSMEYYYYYKSCDVKLMRKLIYFKYPALKSLIAEHDWIQFDFITEVHDDLEDLSEDCNTYNVNYFLFGLKFLGKERTFQMFQSFLDQIEGLLLVRKNETVPPYTNEILSEGMNNVDLVKKLLNRRMVEQYEEKIEQALTFSEFPLM